MPGSHTSSPSRAIEPAESEHRLLPTGSSLHWLSCDPLYVAERRDRGGTAGTLRGRNPPPRNGQYPDLPRNTCSSRWLSESFPDQPPDWDRRHSDWCAKQPSSCVFPQMAPPASLRSRWWRRSASEPAELWPYRSRDRSPRR